MKHQLTSGQALVLVGPQGCGKSTLAREIAEAHGNYREIGVEVLNSELQSHRVLLDEPRTLIIEGFPKSAEAISVVKELLANKTIVARRKYLEPMKVKTPNLIFCSCDMDQLGFGFGLAGCQFNVIVMEPGQ